MENLTGNVHTFNDQLAVSQRIMKDIAKVAREYSLDETSMVGTTKMLAALLTPMGLSGNNMGNAVNMARMFEKSAPVLGIDTGQAQGELVRLISGQASMGDTLFRRLVSDTAPFSKYRALMNAGPMAMHHMGGGPAQMFNMMPMKQRFDMINRAMNQFSSNADVVAGNAALLSNKLMAIKNELIGIDGILIPIGDVLSNQIRPILTKVMEFLEQYGRPAMERFGGALKEAFRDPSRIYATVRQLQQLRGDLHTSIKLVHTLGEVMFALWIVRLPMVATGLRMAGSAMLTFLGLSARFSKFLAGFMEMGLLARGLTVFRFLMGGAAFVLNRMVLPLAAFLGILQLFSRAKGYAEAADAKTLMEQGPKIGKTLAELGAAFKRIVAPFEYLFDTMARSLAPIFQYSRYILFISDNMGLLRHPLESIGTFTQYAVAGMLGLAAAGRQVFDNIVQITMTAFENVGTVIAKFASNVVQAFDKIKVGDFQSAEKILFQPKMGLKPEDFAKPDIISPIEMWKQTVFGVLADMQKSIKNPKDDDKNVSNHVTNIGNVNIRQDFKENMEPDRIAHSLVQTLRGIAVNPTQAAGRSFSGALTR